MLSRRSRASSLIVPAAVAAAVLAVLPGCLPKLNPAGVPLRPSEYVTSVDIDPRTMKPVRDRKAKDRPEKDKPDEEKPPAKKSPEKSDIK